ncbi:MAG: tetraacyldisaccharide 4'-kinase [Holosporaceae bacterium]|nr:tetraacyldisaccharide 4'-kinase [Holosporaceae bacterium]
MFLGPLAKIYSAVTMRNYREKRYGKQRKTGIVVAVGGITMGGSGKTILVREICEMLRGKKIAVLSRGFGRKSSETLRVDNRRHTAEDVGDEPLLLSTIVPVYVGKDRSRSAMQAEAFDVLILDDGITQKFLKPDVKFLVIDSEQRFGNGEMFPLGPNRLDFNEVKRDMDGIIVLGEHPEQFQMDDYGSAVFYATLRSDFSQLQRKIIAFCGLGYPEKFFNSLKSFEIADRIAFPDHYLFSIKDIEKLMQNAKRAKAQLVTTEKDLMRVPREFRQHIATVPVRLEWISPPTEFMCLLRSLGGSQDLL